MTDASPEVPKEVIRQYRLAKRNVEDWMRRRQELRLAKLHNQAVKRRKLERNNKKKGRK